MSQEETDYAWLDGILAQLQESTIIIDVQGSVLGPEEDSRAFKQCIESAKTTIQSHLTAQAKQHQVELVLARLDEIYKLKRSGVTDAIGLYAYQVYKLDFDNRIKQLQAKLAKLENKQ